MCTSVGIDRGSGESLKRSDKASIGDADGERVGCGEPTHVEYVGLRLGPSVLVRRKIRKIHNESPMAAPIFLSGRAPFQRLYHKRWAFSGHGRRDRREIRYILRQGFPVRV